VSLNIIKWLILIIFTYRDEIYKANLAKNKVGTEDQSPSSSYLQKHYWLHGYKNSKIKDNINLIQPRNSANCEQKLRTEKEDKITLKRETANSTQFDQRKVENVSSKPSLPNVDFSWQEAYAYGAGKVDELKLVLRFDVNSKVRSLLCKFPWICCVYNCIF